jgi:hypothetical protein
MHYNNLMNNENILAEFESFIEKSAMVAPQQSTGTNMQMEGSEGIASTPAMGAPQPRIMPTGNFNTGAGAPPPQKAKALTNKPQ